MDDEHLIVLNLEDFGCSDLQDPKKLHQTVLSRVKDNSRYFVFIDEIQWCKGFERVIDSLHLRKNLDILYNWLQRLSFIRRIGDVADRPLFADRSVSFFIL